MPYIITEPFAPLTDENTEGFSDLGLQRLNAAFVTVWNDTFADYCEEGDDPDWLLTYGQAVYEALLAYWEHDEDCSQVRAAIHWATDRLNADWAPPRPLRKLRAV